MSRTCGARIPQQRRLRLIDFARRAHHPWLPLPHVPWGRPIMQRIGSLGWGLGDGSCTSGGLNYACRKAHCACRTTWCQSRNDINTATPVHCPLTLIPTLMRHIKRARRRLDTYPIQCVSYAAVKRCNALVSAYVNVTQTMHAARRPTAHPLYQGHCISCDITISRYEMPRYMD